MIFVSFEQYQSFILVVFNIRFTKKLTLKMCCFQVGHSIHENLQVSRTTTKIFIKSAAEKCCFDNNYLFLLENIKILHKKDLQIFFKHRQISRVACAK